MKIIDDTVFAALQRFYHACGSQRVMGAALGLSRAQVSRVLRRKTASFEDETWKRIRPMVEPHVQMGEDCLPCSSCPKHGSCLLEETMESIFSIPAEYREEWFRELHDFVMKNREKYLSK